MGNVINLANYKSNCRKSYLAKHRSRLDLFVARFVSSNIDVDFRTLAAEYQDRHGGYQEAWDYVDFRELLEEAFEQAFSAVLSEELKKQRWFDGRHVTHAEVLDRCLSAYIIEQCSYALVST
jgi:hypothetical protein